MYNNRQLKSARGRTVVVAINVFLEEVRGQFKCQTSLRSFAGQEIQVDLHVLLGVVDHGLDINQRINNGINQALITHRIEG